MELAPKDRRNIEHIAKDTLSTIETVAETAQNALRESSGIGVESLASINTYTSTSTVRKLGQISSANRVSYQTLAQEPAIARVVVADENNNQHTYYICRAMPVKGVVNLASYRAPIGRLASLPIGEEFRLPNGNIVEVIEQAQLHPAVIEQRWDSLSTVIESDHFGPITIESLRALPQKIPVAEPEEDLLEQLLAEEGQAANIIDGIRRSVITKMGLRDQPILDQYQDEIFRLPLDKRLLILGPPGTGKTTTLIRRLGQKLDTAYLDEDEQHVVDSIASSNTVDHAHSWLMFTPTELLKQYLKEAFACEGVPASDLRIKTWADYRRELARNTFGVLKTVSGSGSFVMKDSIASLAADALDESIAWFSDFDNWQREAFIEGLHKSALGLKEESTPEIAAIGHRLLMIIGNADSRSLANTFIALSAEIDQIRGLLSGLKQETDNKIKGVLNLQLNRNGAFIDELATFITKLQINSDVEIEDSEDQEVEDDEADTPTTGRAAAVTGYMRAVRAQARATVRKRRLGKNTINGKVNKWIGKRTLGDTELAEVGASLMLQSNARQFVNPVNRYINSIRRRYRTFRRNRQKEAIWYRKDGFKSAELHPLELDVVLLAILRGANDLLNNPKIIREIETPVWSSLKPVFDLYNNQVLVDEVTDFSPIQIACMAALSNPRIRSFFACGDFNQRLTTWGSRSIDEIKWVFPEIEVKEITVSYRQSRQLNELAHAIIETAGGTDQEMVLPEHVDSEGVKPVLLEGQSKTGSTVDWLADRIREIERFVGQLPSIAVFVNYEAEVLPVADALSTALADENIQALACTNGQVMGQDNDVRVFDIQHIKGLEFEAVFFLGVDRLAVLHSQLFDKYLYVGTTRAATYLGITCDDALPTAISMLRPMFVSDWKTP